MRAAGPLRAAAAGALLVACGHAAAVERVAPYRVVRATGAYLDWLEGEAGAVGWTPILQKIDQNRALYVKTQRQAEADGRKRLLAALEEVAVGREGRLKDHPDLMDAVRARVEATTSHSVDTTRRERFEAAFKLRLWGEGGLVGLAMERLSDPGDGGDVTAALRPAGRRDAAAPSAAWGRAGEEPGSPSERTSGLLVDATGVEGASPALLPRIVDPQGRVIHGPETADPDFVRTRGLAGYAVPLTSGPKARPEWLREGPAPLHILAVSAAGPDGTDLVISEADAQRVAAAAEASPFLQECRVLVLMPPVSAERPPPVTRPAPRPAADPPPARDPQ